MVELGNDLVKNVCDKLGFNDRPSQVGDCKELDDKDLEASAVADADIPVNLLDSYPELSPAFRQRVQDCSDRNKRLQDVVTGHGGASTAAPKAGENRAPTEGALDNGDTAAMAAPGVVP
jgi:hypothetical protein